MQPRPSFDRTLLIPIAISVISILGIGWLLFTTVLREAFIPPTAVSTALPFDASSLETQAASFYPTPVEASPTAPETEPVADIGTPAEVLLATSTLITESQPTPSASPTPDQIQPLKVGKYDDTNLNIAYDQFWIALKNLSTVNAYQGTIHASNGIGHEASFRFTGTGFRLGYQRGKRFGIVTVLIDNQSYSFHEQAFDLVWNSPQLAHGDHFVRILHESGESINLDYIEILD